VLAQGQQISALRAHLRHTKKESISSRRLPVLTLFFPAHRLREAIRENQGKSGKRKKSKPKMGKKRIPSLRKTDIHV
jgi:hypothetical protein